MQYKKMTLAPESLVVCHTISSIVMSEIQEERKRFNKTELYEG